MKLVIYHNTRVAIGVGLSSFLVSIVASGITPSAINAESVENTIIRNATIHYGDGTVRKGDLVFGAKGRILAAGAAKTAGARVVDGRGKILTPGFVDISTRLGLVDISYLNATREDYAGGDDIRAAFRVSEVLDPASPVIPVARRGGITSALAVPGGGLVSGQSAWIDLAGTSDSNGRHARIVHGRAALHVTLARGYKQETRGGRLLKLRRLFDDLAVFKRGQLTVQIGREHPADRLDFQALSKIQEAGRPVVFRVDRAAHIESVLRFCREHKLQPIIAGGGEAWRVAAELARTKTPVVLNPVANLPSSFDTRAARSDAAAILHRAGVPVLISTFDTHRAYILRQLAGNAVRAGLPYQAALQAITREPARALKMDADYGTLRPGKFANLVLWSGDPFELSSRVEAMWIRGRRVSLESRQTDLLRRYRKLEK